MEDDDNKPNMANIGACITIPFMLALPPIVGWLIGRWLDNLFDASPYLMYTFMVLGFIAGVREVSRIIKRFGKGT